MVTNDVMLLYLCAGFGWGRVTFFTAVIINAICSTSLKHSHELVTGKKTNLSQDKISTIEKSNAYLKYIVQDLQLRKKKTEKTVHEKLKNQNVLVEMTKEHCQCQHPKSLNPNNITLLNCFWITINT